MDSCFLTDFIKVVLDRIHINSNEAYQVLLRTTEYILTRNVLSGRYDLLIVILFYSVVSRTIQTRLPSTVAYCLRRGTTPCSYAKTSVWVCVHYRGKAQLWHLFNK
jgi:hypothetical protein